MALLVTRQVTLTEKNDSGPFFDVYYSTDNGNSYDISPNGVGVYLPSIGSSVTVQVASTTTTIKLVSTGQCTNDVVSGSVITTTTTSTSTTSTTSTTTAGTTTTTTAGTTTTSTTSTTTIPPTTTTTTTTTAAVSCYEYLITCPLGNPTGCNVQYTDCNGDLQSYTQPEDTDYPLCARPTPTVTGGFTEFLGDCGLTTTTTTTTSTTTQALYSGLVRCNDGTTNWYYSGQLTSGQYFLSTGGNCYVSSGTITDISGKTELDGTPDGCTCF